MLAGIVYRDTPYQNFIVSISVLFESKSHKNPINPKDENDFKEATSYFVLWCRCKNEATLCQNQKSCQQGRRTMYECQIFGLACKLVPNFYFCTVMVTT